LAFVHLPPASFLQQCVELTLGLRLLPHGIEEVSFRLFCLSWPAREETADLLLQKIDSECHVRLRANKEVVVVH